MFKKALLPLALVLASSAANAGVITSDTDLLTVDGHKQLAEWLGEDFDLTRIFAKNAGDDSYDWHLEVDNKGRTFTLMEVFDNASGDRRVIGGYNSISWDSSGTWKSSEENFLFNLSSNSIFEKNDRGANGAGATLNYRNYGAIFGNDLVVNRDLKSGASDIGYYYGDKSQFRQASYQEEFAGSYNKWTIGAYETFTLSESTLSFTSDVPASFLLGGLGLFGLLVSRRKTKN